MKKICVMHRASIGDTLLATPVYRAIKECHPEAEVVVVTSRVGYELLQGNPYIDTLLPYEKGDAVFPIIRKIWRAQAAFILDHHYRDALYAFLAMIPKRIGRGKDFINVHVDDPPLLTYEPWKYLNISKHAGIETSEVSLTKPSVKQEEKKHIVEICNTLRLKKNCKIVLLAPYSLDSLKDWEPQKYLRVVHRIQEAGNVAAVIGGKENYHRAVVDFPSVPNLMGATNLRETTELIAQADLLVCGCTSVLHICSTTNTPSVAIYGPSSPLQWAPRHDCAVISHKFSCSPCHNISKVRCQDNKCIQEISVDEVWAKVKEVLKE